MRLAAKRSAAARIVPFITWRDRERKAARAGVEQMLAHRYPMMSDSMMEKSLARIDAYFDGPGARQEWERKRKK